MTALFTDTLLEAVAQAGFDLDHIPEAGRLHRFGKNKSSWIKLFEDGDGAVFGCWREGSTYTWQRSRSGPPPDAAELAALRARAAEAHRQAEEEREAGYQEAAKRAAATWAASTPASDSNGYLVRKQIKAHIARERNGQLVVPLLDAEGNIQSVQSITADGRKQFLPGGRTKGARCWLADPESADTLLLTESFSTSASVFEATGWPTCIAFNAGNLPVIAADVARQFPKKRIVICGDDDRHGQRNIGREKALEAAKLAKGYAVFPTFDEADNKSTDWNDLHVQAGIEAVRDQVMAALEPQQPEHQEGEQQDTPEDQQPKSQQAPVAFIQPALSAADVRDGTARTRPLTEHGNALRLLDQHRDRLRYVPEVQGWLIWRQGWQWDPDGADVRMAAAALPQSIYAEGIGRNMADAEHFAKWARQSQSMRVVQATVQMLSDQRSIRVPMTCIDSDQMLVGYDNARRVIDLRTGENRPATAGDYITKSLTVAEVGDAAKAVRWLQFLDQIFPGDAELIDWLRRWIGYTLTGSTAEQILLFCFGLGANGKSVLGELLRWLLGDYSRAIPVEMLCESKRQAGSATPDIADLVGARLALTTETEDGAALAESLIKSLTAGDTISARPLYGKPFNFAPQFKLLMLGNHRPVVRGTDHGIWRRIRLVPFRRTFAPDERDPHLLDKLKAEAPHILAWMVQGCIDWQRRGLADTPAVVAAETSDYRQEQDVIGEFLAEATVQSPVSEVSAGDLYARYREWAIESGLRPASKTSLGRRLGERGLTRRKSSGQVLWAGLSLKQIAGFGGYAR